MAKRKPKSKVKPTRKNTRAERRQSSRNVNRIKVQRDFVERRLQGGAPATHDAYARAVEQWQQLPGAILRTKLSRSQGVTMPTQASMPPRANKASKEEEKS
jgi:hypothetical protein